jgi:hypothetical protein
MQIVEFSDGRKTAVIPRTGPASSKNKNWITVLIGRNGTKKSLLLRLLLEGALDRSTIETGVKRLIRPQLTMRSQPDQIAASIAIAGTPFDRFPRQTRYQTQAHPTKYDLNTKYFYLGMKAANGTMGSTQGVRTIADLLFRTLATEQQLSGSINRVFDFLDFKPELCVVVRRHTSLNVARGEGRGKNPAKPGNLSPRKLRTGLTHIKNSSSNPQHVTWAQELLQDSLRLKELRLQLDRLPESFYVSFSKSTLRFHDQDWSSEELLRLFEVGLILPSHFMFQRSESDQWLMDSQLSSGQWHLISSMLGLALTLRHDSLVLIDEPENSLHPEWQRTYVELLSEVIEGTDGCHVFIATHSPLIASGVKPDTGDVLRIEAADASALGVELCLLPNTYGWDAGDVYRQVFDMESARASTFIGLANQALALIAEGDRSSRKLKSLAKILSKIRETLPKQDPMRTVLFSIIQSASGQEDDN